MKSSPNLPALFGEDIRNWNPANFPPAGTPVDSLTIDMLMDVLRPMLDPTQPATFQSSGLLQYVNAPSWVPGDFPKEVIPSGTTETFNAEDLRNEKVAPQEPTIYERPSERPHEPRETAEEIIEKANQNAQQILEETRLQVDQLLAETQQKAQEMAQQAFQEAFEKGKQEGYQAGLESAQNETQSVIQTANELVIQFTQWRDEMLAQSENAVIGLVKEMAQSIFGEGIILDSQNLSMTFNRVMENARSLGELKVYVHPDDAITLGPYWRENQMAISGQPIQLIPSDAILRGGCFVDGQFGSIDARVETQLKALLTSLESANQKN